MTFGDALPECLFRLHHLARENCSIILIRGDAMQLEDYFDLIAPDDKAPQRNNVTQMLDEIYAQESSEIDPILLQMQIASLEVEIW